MSFKLNASKQVIMNFISTLKVVAEENAFHITYDGLTAAIIDLSRTTIPYIQYPKKMFKEYSVTAPQKSALDTKKSLKHLNHTTPTKLKDINGLTESIIAQTQNPETAQEKAKQWQQ